MLSVELTSRCSCYVFKQYFAVKRVQCPPDSSAILFKQPKKLNLVPRFPRSSAQYIRSAVGYGELCVWFYPIRNGEIFWMNNNICSCTFVCKNMARKAEPSVQTETFCPLYYFFGPPSKFTPLLPRICQILDKVNDGIQLHGTSSRPWHTGADLGGGCRECAPPFPPPPPRWPAVF